MEHTPILPAGASLSAFQGLLLTNDAGIDPLSAVARALAGFNRDQLGSTIELLIDLVDITDGDPDLEADDRAGETIAVMDDPDVPPAEDDGDPDLEQTMDEDDWYPHAANGPGCPIADAGGAGEGEDDEKDGTGEGDISWAEWHTLPTATRRAGDIEGTSTLGWLRTIHEDLEDDDPSGQCDEDGIDTELVVLRRQYAGPGCTISDPDYDPVDVEGELDDGEHGLTPDYAIDQTKCLPDAMVIAADRQAIAPHRKRIQRDRCVPRYFHSRRFNGSGITVRPEILGYNLINAPIVPSRRSLLHRKRGMPRRPRG